MAKRKRLTPAQPGSLDTAPAGGISRPSPLSAPPIAQVAGEASATAALAELSAEMDLARKSGRIITEVPLAAIDPFHLVRDRLEMDEDDLHSLMTSLQARGQQIPAELVELPPSAGGVQYGLISGWRRLTALKRLYAETGDDRFATLRAMIVAPETAQDAYVAMVEENEIRVSLSFYERARIALRAVRGGVFEDQRAALRGLFGAVSRSKRSKIGSFIPLVETFDGVLRHPAAISEKLGLALTRELGSDPDFGSDVINRLASEAPETAAEETDLLAQALITRRPAPADQPAPEPVPPKASPPEEPAEETLISGVRAVFRPARGRVELTGPEVDAAFYDALREWLAAR